jgi:hypothetical protein
MLTAALLTSSLSYSQSVTNSSDSLIYTPQYLFELMVADLEQCDLDRIELKKAKAELAIIYVDLAKSQSYRESMKQQLNSMSAWNDSLSTANMTMALENQRAMDKLKRGRNWWRVGTFAGFLTAVGVHFNWKESWFKVGK